MNKYKFVVIGDSFALPRMYAPKTNTIDDITNSKGVIEVTGREIYPELLKDKLEENFGDTNFSFINLSVHANTSYNLFNYKCLDLYMEQPDFFILQIGLVDCWNRKGINWGPFPHMAGKDPWVSISEYERDITGVVKFTFDICKVVKYIFILNIPFIKNEQYEKHPNSYERSLEYNKILEKISQENKNIVLVDVFSFFQKIEDTEFKNLFCHDNAHYNGKGNKIVAELIYEKAVEIIKYFEAENEYRVGNSEKALKILKEINLEKLTEDYQEKTKRMSRICEKKVKK